MLQQQLEAAKKENTALKRRLEVATAALASANLSSANPALLRVMQAGAKGGSQRGAGGTPHALALAWAREEAARLSPALTLVRPLARTNFSIVVNWTGLLMLQISRAMQQPLTCVSADTNCQLPV